MVDHTMFRIKDAKVSLDFYQRILGMELSTPHPRSLPIRKFLLMVHAELRVVQESPGGDFTKYAFFSTLPFSRNGNFRS